MYARTLSLSRDDSDAVIEERRVRHALCVLRHVAPHASLLPVDRTERGLRMRVRLRGVAGHADPLVELDVAAGIRVRIVTRRAREFPLAGGEAAASSQAVG